MYFPTPKQLHKKYPAKYTCTFCTCTCICFRKQCTVGNGWKHATGL